MKKLNFDTKNQQSLKGSMIKTYIVTIECVYIKLHISFHLIPRLMTLNDLEWLFQVTFIIPRLLTHKWLSIVMSAPIVNLSR